ncbi:MAG: calcium-binding protein [Microcoleaceae cyanobacterium]
MLDNIDLFTTLIGSSNDDLLNGTSGSDQITGGAGNDTITGDVSPVIGISTRSATLGLSNATFATQSVQNGAGNDTLNGGNGNDWVSGGEGNDYLDGGNHNDTLIGGNDNDTLIGGAHNDSLVGGPGRDWFFLSPDGLDIVADYTAGQQDELVLSRSVFGLNTAAGRALNTSELRTVSRDVDAVIYSSSAPIIYSQQSKQLFHDGEAFARMGNNLPSMSSADFWIVA